MVDRVKDEVAVPEAKGLKDRKPYVRPSLRRLGSVRELTAGGTSATNFDALHMMAM